MNQFKSQKYLGEAVVIMDVLKEIARGAGILVILATFFVIGAMIGGGA